MHFCLHTYATAYPATPILTTEAFIFWNPYSNPYTFKEPVQGTLFSLCKRLCYCLWMCEEDLAQKPFRGHGMEQMHGSPHLEGDVLPEGRILPGLGSFYRVL